jgi:hypothetical protein
MRRKRSVPRACESLKNLGCTTEAAATAGQEVCASLTATTLQGTYSVGTPDSVPGANNVFVDTYRFTLPNGVVATLPCVVLVSGAIPVDPYAAGGTYVATLATLTDGPSPNPLAEVGVCNANLTLTADGIGINSFPALTVC